MNKILGSLLVAGILLVAGFTIGRFSPDELQDMARDSLGLSPMGSSTASESTASSGQASDTGAGGNNASPEEEETAAAADLPSLEELNLRPGDPPGTVYFISARESLEHNSLESDQLALDEALISYQVLETRDRRGNQWFVLAIGEYTSVEQAQRANAVINSRLGIGGTVKKFPAADDGN